MRVADEDDRDDWVNKLEDAKAQPIETPSKRSSLSNGQGLETPLRYESGPPRIDLDEPTPSNRQSAGMWKPAQTAVSPGFTGEVSYQPSIIEQSNVVTETRYFEPKPQVVPASLRAYDADMQHLSLAEDQLAAFWQCAKVSAAYMSQINILELTCVTTIMMRSTGHL